MRAARPESPVQSALGVRRRRQAAPETRARPTRARRTIYPGVILAPSGRSGSTCRALRAACASSRLIWATSTRCVLTTPSSARQTRQMLSTRRLPERALLCAHMSCKACRRLSFVPVATPLRDLPRLFVTSRYSKFSQRLRRRSTPSSTSQPSPTSGSPWRAESDARRRAPRLLCQHDCSISNGLWESPCCRTAVSTPGGAEPILPQHHGQHRHPSRGDRSLRRPKPGPLLARTSVLSLLHSLMRAPVRCVCLSHEQPLLARRSCTRRRAPRMATPRSCRSQRRRPLSLSTPTAGFVPSPLLRPPSSPAFQPASSAPCVRSASRTSAPRLQPRRAS